MSAGEAIAGFQVLQNAFEKRNQRQFDWATLLQQQDFTAKKTMAEQKFAAGESEKERQNRIKLAGISITPAMSRLDEEKRIELRKEAGQDAAALEMERRSGEAGSPAWTGKSEPNPTMMAQSKLMGSGLLSGGQIQESMMSPEQTIAMMTRHLMSIKDPTDAAIYKNILSRSMEQLQYVRKTQAQYDAERNYLLEGRHMTQQKVDLNEMMPELLKTFDENVPDWDVTQPLGSYLHNAYGKDSVVQETKIKDAIKGLIKKTYGTTALGSDDAAQSLMANDLMQTFLTQGVRGIIQPESQGIEETTLGQRLKAKFIREPLESMGSFGYNATKTLGLDKPEITRARTYFKKEGNLGTISYSTPVSMNAFMSQNYGAVPTTPQTPASNVLFQPKPVSATPSTPQAATSTVAQPTTVNDLGSHLLGE